MHSLYGLKQAGQVWNRTFAHTIKEKLAFNTVHSDVGVYVLHHHYKRGEFKYGYDPHFICQWPVTLGRRPFKIEDVKHQLDKLYQMKDLRPASSYLGIWITRDWNTWAIQINQQAYMENTLKRFELQYANSTKTPLQAGIHLEKSKEPVAINTKTYYQQIIGTLIYAAIGTRPNITFVAMRLSRFNNNPMQEHIKYAKHVLWYLKGTKDLKIKYDGDSDARLIGYSDSDWGGNRDDHHSTSGHIFLMANGAISWHLSDKKRSHCQWEKLNIWN